MTAQKCIECGLCKNSCPVYRALLRETVSPRGKAKLIKKETYEDIIHLCTLCEACVEACPHGVRLDLEKIREKMVDEGKELSANKRMIRRLRKNNNPYIPTEEEKIGRFGVKNQ